MKNRRKFLFTGISLAALWASIRFGFKKTPQSRPVKFLTHDGKLVEVGIDKLPASKKTATREDIQHWVKMKKSA